jgi:membrane protease YdiL (CAAX protease family)
MGTVVRFFALTFAVTWTFFGAAVVASRGTDTGDAWHATLSGVLVFAGTMAPALVALAMSARREGGIAAIIDRLGRWHVGLRWYLFALGYMAAVRFAAALVCRLSTGAWPVIDSWAPAAVVVSIVLSTPFQAGEEIGWRGYALPRLAERMGWAGGSVVLGVLWACWHLPLFVLRVPGNNEYGQSFTVWGLGVTALSVAMAWLYLRTAQSLPVVMLMHAAVNNFPHFVPPAAEDARNVFSLHAPLAAWLTTVFLWVGAAWFLWRMHGSNRQPSRP